MQVADDELKGLAQYRRRGKETGTLGARPAQGWLPPMSLPYRWVDRERKAFFGLI